MRCYFAPMEALTDSIFRQVHHRYFPGVDGYYMPFFSPTIHRRLTAKEERELPLADSVGFFAVPQVLTKVPEDFLWFAQQCRDRGYEELNLNLGCPSGTVTAKGKGSAMLRSPEALDRFLEAVYSAAPLPVSVKTRMGVERPEELPALMDVFNRYPIRLLILHPRVQKSFYQGKADMEAFRYLAENSVNPVCCNGGFCSGADLEAFADQYPQTPVMVGRGLIGDPGMRTPGGTTREALKDYLEELLDTYTQQFGSARNAMFRMKENWRYLSCRFDGGEKLYKQLRKTTSVEEYRAITARILETLPLRPALEPDW